MTYEWEGKELSWRDAVREIGRILTKISKPRRIAPTNKKDQQRYIILLSNDVAIIDTEWSAMKRARFLMSSAKHRPTYKSNNLRIVEMYPTSSRLIAQETTLTKLLEALDHEK